MFQTLKNAWKTPELKNKLLFTLVIVILYRIGANIMVPWIDTSIVGDASRFSGTILDYLNTLSGGALSQATLFALSVSPYITASIVMQLLTIAIPKLEELAKDGEEGKKKISAITRIVTVVLALITSFGYTMMIMSQNMTTLCELKYNTLGQFTGVVWKTASHYGVIGEKFNMVEIFKNGAGLQFVTIIACYCAGAALVMWLAEKINEKGIGNGISIILFANILSGVPGMVSGLWALASTPFKMHKGSFHAAMIVGPLVALVVVAAVIAAAWFVIWFTNSERRIPVQYAKRVVGRKMYGGQASNLPLKLNMSGVMPIIFANAIVTIPATIAMFTGNVKAEWMQKVNAYIGKFNQANPVYIVLFAILLVAFAFFYIMISFNPVEVSNNIRNNGGAVPGIRPGKPTKDYIQKILNRVTFIGAIFLAVIAVLPMIVYAILSIDAINVATANFFGVFLVRYYNYASGVLDSIAFSGSSLLIVTGVAIETVRELEAQLTMRNYKGFLD